MVSFFTGDCQFVLDMIAAESWSPGGFGMLSSSYGGLGMDSCSSICLLGALGEHPPSRLNVFV